MVYVLIYFVKKYNFDDFQTIEILDLEVPSKLFLLEERKDKVADLAILTFVEFDRAGLGCSLLLLFGSDGLGQVLLLCDAGWVFFCNFREGEGDVHAVLI